MSKWMLALTCGLLPLASPAIAAERSSDAGDRVGVSLSLYGSGQALIHEERTVDLAPGPNRLVLTAISRHLVEDSVRVAGDLRHLAQQYRFDLSSRQQLLEQHIGRRLQLAREHPQGGETLTVDAELVAVMDGHPVYRLDDRLELGNDDFPWRPRLDTDVLALTPTLYLDVEAQRRGPQALELTYLSSGLGWRANYTARLHGADDKLDLSAWARIDNQTGVDFADAEVHLIAGEPLPAAADSTVTMRALGPRAEAAAEAFSAAGPYRRYSLPAPIDLPSGSSPQFRLFELTDLAVAREYRLRATGSRPQVGERHYNAELWLQLHNDPQHLGQPLPAGTLRLYQHDDQQPAQLIGSAELPHLAVGQRWEAPLGRAFDISARRLQTGLRDLGEQGRELEWELRLENAGDESVVVMVEETLHGDWRLLDASRSPSDSRGQQLRWLIELPANGGEELSYRVQVR